MLGFHFYELAPTLINEVAFGKAIINPDYSADPLAAAIALHEGFTYQYTNIAVKKIPQMLLDRCEFGKDDYSLNIVHPSAYEDEEVEDDE